MVADNASKEQVIAILNTFKHGRRTNVAKGIMNNHDAAAFLFWHLGPMKVREVITLLQNWRGKVPHYTGGTSNLIFTYLFNGGLTSGYGFVAESVMSRGNFLKTYSYGDNTKAFRRTFWFRVKTGNYAPTLECAKRMRELNLA